MFWCVGFEIGGSAWFTRCVCLFRCTRLGDNGCAVRFASPPLLPIHSLLSPSREMRVPSGNRGRWWTGVPELSRGAATPAEVHSDGAGPPPTLCSLLLLSLWFSLVLCGFVLRNWFDLWMKGKGGVNWRMVVLWICDAKLDLVHAWDWLGLDFHCGFLAWDLFVRWIIDLALHVCMCAESRRYGQACAKSSMVEI